MAAETGSCREFKMLKENIEMLLFIVVNAPNYT